MGDCELLITLPLHIAQEIASQLRLRQLAICDIARVFAVPEISLRKELSNVDRLLDWLQADMPMPWCGWCGSYHAATAQHITKNGQEYPGESA